MVLSAVLVLNIGLTLASPRVKRAAVRLFQRWVMNPIVKLFFALGVVPFGYVLIETTGRTSGLPRTTPVGNGLRGSTLWVIAEHGLSANYVRNIQAQPKVRVKLRRGLRFVYENGNASVLPEDDVLARQKMVCGWRPLRLLNAIVVRTLGTDLVTIRIELDTPAS